MNEENGDFDFVDEEVNEYRKSAGDRMRRIVDILSSLVVEVDDESILAENEIDRQRVHEAKLALLIAIALLLPQDEVGEQFVDRLNEALVSRGLRVVHIGR